MTVSTAISKINERCPNAADDSEQRELLERVDAYVYADIMYGREMDKETVQRLFPNLNEGDPLPSTRVPVYTDVYTDTDADTDTGTDTGTDEELLIPAPYDELYLYRLEAEAYYRQHESKKYANAMALYNQVMFEYKNKYAREHRALPHPPVRYW